MKIILLATAMISYSTILSAQQQDSISNFYSNIAEQLMTNSGKLNIGGYGEVHYNQPFSKNQSELGTLDVHRIVMFLGYNFTSKTQFVSEIEFEYAKELWVEQAFLQHKINKYINFRAGLLLVPMGIINEFHEPTTFNGVERPIIDNKIAPSTWREIGAGFSGNVLPLSLKYQAYIVGGLNGYDTRGTFTGDRGLREGRQKGSKAYVNTPALASKIEYFGIKNLNIGLSGYFGKSQSRLYNKLHNDSTALKTNADSSIVKIMMIGSDFRYLIKWIEIRGQLYYTLLSNTEQYNVYTRTGEKNNDLGKEMFGYYTEIACNVLRFLFNTDYELIPFIRYEFYDMHHSVDNAISKNDNYKNTVITSGLTFKLNKNAVLKADIQFIKPATFNEWSKTLNAGIGVMF